MALNILDFATQNGSLADRMQAEVGTPTVVREPAAAVVNESVSSTAAVPELSEAQVVQDAHRVFSASWRTYQHRLWRGGLFELRCAPWVKVLAAILVLSTALSMLLNLTFRQLLRVLDMLARILSPLFGQVR